MLKPGQDIPEHASARRDRDFQEVERAQEGRGLSLNYERYDRKTNGRVTGIIHQAWFPPCVILLLLVQVCLEIRALVDVRQHTDWPQHDCRPHQRGLE